MKKYVMASLLLLMGGAGAAVGQDAPVAYPTATVPNYSAADTYYDQRYATTTSQVQSRSLLGQSAAQRRDSEVFSNYEPQPQSSHAERQAQNDRLMFLMKSL